jgi:hypothetical protein
MKFCSAMQFCSAQFNMQTWLLAALAPTMEENTQIPITQHTIEAGRGAGECRVSQEVQGRTPAQLLSLKEQTSEPLHQYQRQGNGLYHEK